MKRFIEGQDRSQVILLPECLDDYLGEDNPVRVVDVFVDELSLEELGFEGAQPAATGRPSYHPAVLLKIYIYGYLNQVQSSRRLEREAQRNIELMWLTGRLAPDFKTIADFRKDHGTAIRNVCREFVLLCRRLQHVHRQRHPAEPLEPVAGVQCLVLQHGPVRLRRQRFRGAAIRRHRHA